MSSLFLPCILLIHYYSMCLVKTFPGDPIQCINVFILEPARLCVCPFLVNKIWILLNLISLRPILFYLWYVVVHGVDIGLPGLHSVVVLQSWITLFLPIPPSFVCILIGWCKSSSLIWWKCCNPSNFLSNLEKVLITHPSPSPKATWPYRLHS